jgi:IgA-specific serine endopeptidase
MQKRHGEASQELAAKAKAASGSEQRLSGERASFEIERNALLADIKSLSNQLEEARAHAASQAAAGGDAQRLQAESLAQAQVQARELESEAAGLKQQLAALAEEKSSMEDTLQRLRQLQGAKEEEVARIRAQLNDANQANDANTRQFEAQLVEAKAELAASVQAKEALEEEQRAQFAQMQAREQKAAQECERMFKLVQQAHVKVQEKEKDFKKQLDAERARFNTAMQSEIDRRMEGVQAKYEEEARQRRKLFNIVQELQGNIRCAV